MRRMNAGLKNDNFQGNILVLSGNIKHVDLVLRIE